MADNSKSREASEKFFTHVMFSYDPAQLHTYLSLKKKRRKGNEKFSRQNLGTKTTTMKRNDSDSRDALGPLFSCEAALLTYLPYINYN